MYNQYVTNFPGRNMQNSAVADHGGGNSLRPLQMDTILYQTNYVGASSSVPMFDAGGGVFTYLNE